MSIPRSIIKSISRYLRRSDSHADKRSLVDWYNSLPNEQRISAEYIDDVGLSVKKRVFNSIREERILARKNNMPTLLKYAAALLVTIGIGYWYMQSGIDNSYVSQAQLATILPQQGQVTITTDDGEMINLDSLPLNGRIYVGENEIRKDQNGHISYHPLSKGAASLVYSTIQTSASSNYRITMSDSTVVVLNSNSKLRYPNTFDVGDRSVELEGEAYFMVNKTENKQRFIVKTKQQSTEVLGTKFSVKTSSLGDKTLTTLEEGAVRISSTHNHKTSALLKPGEQSTIANEQINIKPIDIEQALAWVNGWFYLDGNNTESVLNEIAAWYDIDLTYQKKNEKRVFKGKIPKDLPLNKLLQLLEFTELKTKAVHESNRIRLLVN